MSDNKIVSIGVRQNTAAMMQPPGGPGNGGGMDDVLRRLGTVEKDVSEIKTQVGAIAAVLPHLATKSDLSDLRGSLSGLETSILKWVVATGVAIIMVVIAAAKLL